MNRDRTEVGYANKISQPGQEPEEIRHQVNHYGGGLILHELFAEAMRTFWKPQERIAKQARLNAAEDTSAANPANRSGPETNNCSCLDCPPAPCASQKPAFRAPEILFQVG